MAAIEGQQTTSQSQKDYDLIVIGGGINGAGIAADAAGRGLNVLLLEAKDLASATSSASSKLIHGGLRYLEHYEFKLVSESLSEREVLLKLAPQLAFPMRFRLPHEPHLRPAWMIRAGLFLYDHLGKKMTLPKSHSIKFGPNSAVKSHITKGFEYSDCWVDDARLVVLNAQEVVRKGGCVKTRTKVTGADFDQSSKQWAVTAQDELTGQTQQYHSKVLVNAAGPWVRQLFDNTLSLKAPYGIRLIKGSHIVVPRVHDEPEAYILQNKDNRIVFVIPWLEEFSIIGTTDLEYKGDPREVKIDQSEIDYLLDIHNTYFKKQLTNDDLVWSYSGVRPLCDDESDSPQAITRDYTLAVDTNVPLLSVFGGKLTTYRKLAEHAMEKLNVYFPHLKPAWTHTNVLPGGDLGTDRQAFFAKVWKQYPWLDEKTIKHYAFTYGTHINLILGEAHSVADLGEHFGSTLYEAELRYLMKHEWVKEGDDALWRRTKHGMKLSASQQQHVAEWIKHQLAA